VPSRGSPCHASGRYEASTDVHGPPFGLAATKSLYPMGHREHTSVKTPIILTPRWCSRSALIQQLAGAHSPVEQRHLDACRLASEPAKAHSPCSQMGGRYCSSNLDGKRPRRPRAPPGPQPGARLAGSPAHGADGQGWRNVPVRRHAAIDLRKNARAAVGVMYEPTNAPTAKRGGQRPGRLPAWAARPRAAPARTPASRQGLHHRGKTRRSWGTAPAVPSGHVD
jgi:hypothetical protein